MIRIVVNRHCDHTSSIDRLDDGLMKIWREDELWLWGEFQVDGIPHDQISISISIYIDSNLQSLSFSHHDAAPSTHETSTRGRDERMTEYYYLSRLFRGNCLVCFDLCCLLSRLCKLSRQIPHTYELLIVTNNTFRTSNRSSVYAYSIAASWRKCIDQERMWLISRYQWDNTYGLLPMYIEHL